VPSMPELERRLLTKMAPSELQQAIEQQLAKGARNRYSALSKLAKEFGNTILEEDMVVEGVYLHSYHSRRSNSFNIVVLTPDGPTKLKVDAATAEPEMALTPLLPIAITGVQRMQGSEETITWLQTTRNTKVESSKTVSRLDVYKWAKRMPVNPDEDGGRICLVAPVMYVNDQATWEGGQKGEANPIIDPQSDRVNLSIQFGNRDDPEMGTIRVYIPNTATLNRLISEDDIAWLESMERDGRHEDAMRELSDMFRRRDLLVLGLLDGYRWVPPNDERANQAVEAAGRRPKKGQEDYVLIPMATPTIRIWEDGTLFATDDYLQSTLDKWVADTPDTKAVDAIKTRLSQGPCAVADLQKACKAAGAGSKAVVDKALAYLADIGVIFEGKDNKWHLVAGTQPEPPAAAAPTTPDKLSKVTPRAAVPAGKVLTPTGEITAYLEQQDGGEASIVDLRNAMAGKMSTDNFEETVGILLAAGTLKEPTLSSIKLATVASTDAQDTAENADTAPPEGEAGVDALLAELRNRHSDSSFSRNDVLEAAGALGIPSTEARKMFNQAVDAGDIIKEGTRGPYTLF